MVHPIEGLRVGAQVNAYLDDTYLEQVEGGWRTRRSPRSGTASRDWWRRWRQKVRARIDLQTRAAHAALHTAGHLVEAVGRMQGWETVGSNHFPGQARIEFQAPQTDARLADPEGREEVSAALRAAAAAAVADDLSVFARCLADGRRVVHLDALHAAPCGGTHVRTLGDLAEVVPPTLKVKKGCIRVSYTATHRSR
ncbi:metal-dependent hydrolase [Streptomyces avermitilis]|uniref:metal-dependent hydrolase n=1 Tax=Streptomyces avermitilis TaxID=33903 RepID=UPI003828E4B5